MTSRDFTRASFFGAGFLSSLDMPAFFFAATAYCPLTARGGAERAPPEFIPRLRLAQIVDAAQGTHGVEYTQTAGAHEFAAPAERLCAGKRLGSGQFLAFLQCNPFLCRHECVLRS